MRALGLIVGGMFALAASIAGHAAPSGSSMKQLVPASGIVHVWGGCGWGWHRCLAIGADGEADGFPRIARLTTIIADGTVTARDKALMEFGVLTVIGAAPTKVGMVPAHKP